MLIRVPLYVIVGVSYAGLVLSIAGYRYGNMSWIQLGSCLRIWPESIKDLMKGSMHGDRIYISMDVLSQIFSGFSCEEIFLKLNKINFFE